MGLNNVDEGSNDEGGRKQIDQNAQSKRNESARRSAEAWGVNQRASTWYRSFLSRSRDRSQKSEVFLGSRVLLCQCLQC